MTLKVSVSFIETLYFSNNLKCERHALVSLSVSTKKGYMLGLYIIKQHTGTLRVRHIITDFTAVRTWGLYWRFGSCGIGYIVVSPSVYPVSAELAISTFSALLSFLGNPQGLEGNLLQNAGNYCATERLPHSGRLISNAAVRTSHLSTPTFYISIFRTTKNIFTGSCV
jgi:hypothetical protein